MQLLQLALDMLDAEALDLVTLADVLIILERHAAFLTARHFGNFVLEALEGGQLAFMDNHIVAQQANAGTTLDLAFGDRQPATLPTFETLKTSRISA